MSTKTLRVLLQTGATRPPSGEEILSCVLGRTWEGTVLTIYFGLDGDHDAFDATSWSSKSPDGRCRIAVGDSWCMRIVERLMHFGVRCLDADARPLRSPLLVAHLARAHQMSTTGEPARTRNCVRLWTPSAARIVEVRIRDIGPDGELRRTHGRFER